MRQIADKIYVETTYPGVNVGAVVTRRGILCIDTPSFPRDARTWATRVHQLHPYSVSFLILTDAHGDRILNSRWLNTAIICQQNTEELLASYDKRYPQKLIDSLVARDPLCGRELMSSPVEKPSIGFEHDLTLGYGQHRVELLSMPGPLPSSTWVHIPEAGVLFAGDSIVVDEPPNLAHANCDSWLASLDCLLNDARYSSIQTIVPGRGALCDKSAIAPLMRYIRQMQEAVREHIAQGLSRSQLSRLIPSCLPDFPTGRWPVEWETKQLRLGLEHLYDEIQLQEPTLAPQ